MAKTFGFVTAGTLAALLTLSTGCRVDDYKHGSNDDVKIATPFGGMSVQTNEAVVAGGVGLSVYPGAVLEKKSNGKDNDGADINMSFGSFHLGVKALSYKTSDSPDKVIAFYRNDMSHFGTTILCRGSVAVGTPDHTPDGLTCDKDHGGSFHVDDEKSQQELKAGSKQHQHIVAVSGDGSGTRIGLIALDLPSHVGKSENIDKD